MALSTLQQKAWDLTKYPSKGANLNYPILGLAQAAGEVAQKAKHVVRDDGGRLTDKKRWEIAMAVGEVLRSCALIATEIELDLDHIAERVEAKVLAKRSRAANG